MLSEGNDKEREAHEIQRQRERQRDRETERDIERQRETERKNKKSILFVSDYFISQILLFLYYILRLQFFKKIIIVQFINNKLLRECNSNFTAFL